VSEDVGSDLKSLLARGNDYAARGDVRSAVSFYQTALKTAGDAGSIEPQTMAELRRAQEFVLAQVKAFQASLERAMAGARPASREAAIRLQHSFEMLTGRRQVYQQQPSVFYYPYLAQRQFFEREEFGWAENLEAAAPAIRAELLALLDEGANFRPYVENDADRPFRDFHGLNDNTDWTALYLWRDGNIVEENAKHFPATLAALEKVPLSAIGSRTPAVLFSRLEAGAHIPSHNGMLNCRAICHLPLVVPKGCWLRVGNETRQWEEGKLLIFDDSFEHEAKNPTDQLRIILLFDVWRPEITEEEKSAISSIFNTIDDFQTLPSA
jgi:aspartyl/asparaginyl beta-hydroxylase (cupin superfamily)